MPDTAIFDPALTPEELDLLSRIKINVDVIPELESFSPGRLPSPAPNEIWEPLDWHQILLDKLAEADWHYDSQYEALVDTVFILARQNAVLQRQQGRTLWAEIKHGWAMMRRWWSR